MTLWSLLGILMFVIGAPAVFAILYFMPQSRRLMLSLMVFSTCHIKKPFYMEVFFQPYRGVERGFGVTIPDLLFFGFALLIMSGATRKKIIWLPYNSMLWLLLILIAMLSISGSAMPLYGWFAVHKFIRCLVLYWVMVNIVQERRDVLAVIYGLVGAILFQGTVVFWQKYVTRTVVYRSMGSFNHPNAMAMYIELVLPILTALVLERLLPGRWNTAATIAVPLGLLAVVFTKSRAGMVMLPAAMGGVTAVSILIKPTMRKGVLIATALCFAGVVMAIALPRIIKRFQEAPEESAQTRVYFNQAARAMANNRFFGVGINLFSWSLANTEYYWYVYPDRLEERNPEEFRDSPMGQSRLGTAHHLYYLYAGEIGWLGMWTFILFIARFMLRNVLLFLRCKDPFYKALLLGMLAGFALVHMHSTLEWIMRQVQPMYMFFLLSGLMIAIGNLIDAAPAPAAAAAVPVPPA